MILKADSEGPDQTAHAQSDQDLRCPQIIGRHFLLVGLDVVHVTVIRAKSYIPSETSVFKINLD